MVRYFRFSQRYYWTVQSSRSNALPLDVSRDSSCWTTCPEDEGNTILRNVCTHSPNTQSMMPEDTQSDVTVLRSATSSRHPPRSVRHAASRQATCIHGHMTSGARQLYDFLTEEWVLRQQTRDFRNVDQALWHSNQGIS